MRLLLAAPALRLQLACSGPLYPSRRSLCPRSRAWPRVTGRWQWVYEHPRSAIYCLPSPAVVKIHCVSRVLGLHISRRQAGRRTPRHNQRRPAQPQAPRTRRHDRPHARLAPGDDRRMEREASRSGRRRRQTPKKQVTGIRGWLRTNDLRSWRPPLYVWCESSGICGVRHAASISRRHACRGNRNRLCINTNNRSRGSLEVVRIFRLSRSSRACRPRLGRAAGLESSRHRVSAWEAALRLRRLLSRIGMTHFARDAPAGYGADAESPTSPRHPQAR